MQLPGAVATLTSARKVRADASAFLNTVAFKHEEPHPVYKLERMSAIPTLFAAESLSRSIHILNDQAIQRALFGWYLQNLLRLPP